MHFHILYRSFLWNCISCNSTPVVDELVWQNKMLILFMPVNMNLESNKWGHPKSWSCFYSENSHILPSDWPDVGRFICFTHWNSSEAKTAGLSFNISGHNAEISLIWDQFNRRLGPLFLETICRWYPEMKRNAFLSHLNSVEPSNRFTLEREKNRHFPLFYLNVYREKREFRDKCLS